MSYKSLREFIELLEENGDLIRITEFVDPVLEIAEVTDRICKQDGGGKAILFENTGTSFPVVTNVFGSLKRASSALNVRNPDEVAQQIEGFVGVVLSLKKGFFEKFSTLPKLAQVMKCLPKTVRRRGECQQVIQIEPDLSIFPILQCWPHDGGRFITLPMVITQDPDTKVRNVGMYRMQVFGSNLTGMHWHRHKTGARHFSAYKKRGELMPVAVALGGDPAYTYSATAPLPENIDEFLFAGFLRKKRVKLVRCITNELDVPSDADIIIEGYVDPMEDPIWEGPFGDHTGFYSLADWYPKFHVTCITYRKDAIFPATLVGVPPMEDVYIAKLTERIFLSPIKYTFLPEIIDLYLPQQGVSHNIAIVKIDKTFPGQAYKVASALWGVGQMMFNKIMIVVDGDTDIHNSFEVAKHISELVVPHRDVLLWRGPMDVLDHASSRPHMGGKVLVDATKKFPEELDNKVNSTVGGYEKLFSTLSQKHRGLFDFNTALLKEGISVLLVSVDKKIGVQVKTIIQQIVAAVEGPIPKFIAVVDKEMKLNDMSLFVWYLSANIDPERDCYFVDRLGVRLPCFVFDGTRKCYSIDTFSRDWPALVVSSKETIEKIDKKWGNFNIKDSIESPSRKFLYRVESDGAIVKPDLT
ncbi:MAG TPA: menaquinone biosynthesis decarboxylase [Tenuifilaceae bacterium]|nr:menaquinone biosynthesis decarboxylase [Tenuifilaceae bacterium]HPE17537.1 menaquinone biosynthesis decarboxylase [Tenuifilaceae bacterium]HPJ45781.1 menaquinone biosynthesis decarboxylase [Tenuifilaceae bacterium]HRX68174.1 menaquinone biosynthesis decarboxylase [Tenuifilaceae bacterium]